MTHSTPSREDVKCAHAHSSNHRTEISNSTICGCFFCKQTFAPSEIIEWIDEDNNGVGQCALCPRCGIDSVIGSASGFPINTAFLGATSRFWF